MINFSQYPVWVLLLIILWVLPWKGYALWVSAHKEDKVWFILLLILNTFAILEIIYVFFIAKKTSKDILRIFKSKSQK